MEERIGLTLNACRKLFDVPHIPLDVMLGAGYPVRNLQLRSLEITEGRATRSET
jgi:hypothetical protein